MSPLLKPITSELGWTCARGAAAMNFRLLLLMLVAPFAGRLVDRFGARVLAVARWRWAWARSALSSITTLGQLYGINLLIGPGRRASARSRARGARAAAVPSPTRPRDRRAERRRQPDHQRRARQRRSASGERLRGAAP
ncbi:MAG: hypothetical protein U1E86_28640 [Burkholderiaceae bacterium]